MWLAGQCANRVEEPVEVPPLAFKQRQEGGHLLVVGGLDGKQRIVSLRHPGVIARIATPSCLEPRIARAEGFEYFDLAVGESMTPFDLATTGLAKRKALRTEVTLRCLNQAASGIVADLS